MQAKEALEKKSHTKTEFVFLTSCVLKYLEYGNNIAVVHEAERCFEEAFCT